MVLWVPVSAAFCRRAVLMQWHASLLLGLRFSLFSSFCLVVSATFSCKKFPVKINVVIENRCASSSQIPEVV
jgi:hypothetical protein